MAKQRGSRRRTSDGITARQRQVLELALARLTNAEIADRLGIKEGTVRAHMKGASGASVTRRRRARDRDGALNLTSGELQLLVAAVQNSHVAEIARLLQLSPRHCRRSLEAIAQKVRRFFDPPSNEAGTT